MFRSIHFAENPCIERLPCYLLISIQYLILQKEFSRQTLIYGLEGGWVTCENSEIILYIYHRCARNQYKTYGLRPQLWLLVELDK